MKFTSRLAAPNSLICLATSSSPTIPDIDGVGALWQTEDCVVIGTLAEPDGETEIELTDEDASSRELILRYTGSLANSTGKIEVQTIFGDSIASMAVDDDPVSLRVWASDDDEPEFIVFEVRQ